MRRTISRWESPRGKHWVELYAAGVDERAYGYVGNGCGGWLAATNEADARVEMLRKINAGYFLPDNAKQSMVLVAVSD